MKQIIYLFLLAITFAACGPGKDKVRLKGEYKNLKTAQFFIYAEDGSLGEIDTLKLRKGKFDTSFSLDTTCIVEIVYPNHSHTSLVASPGVCLELSADAHDLRNVAVSGDKPNERLADFRIANNDKPLHTQQLAAQQYIRDHADGLDAVVVLKEYFLNAPKSKLKEVAPLLRLLQQKHPRNKMLSDMQRHYLAHLRTTHGQRLPSFSAPFLYDSLRHDSLYHYSPQEGKSTFIIVWAKWQSESPSRLYKAVALANKYKESMQSIALCLDADRKGAAQMLKEVKWPGIALIDTLSLRSPLVDQLHLTSVPMMIYADKDGRLSSVPAL